MLSHGMTTVLAFGIRINLIANINNLINSLVKTELLHTVKQGNKDTVLTP